MVGLASLGLLTACVSADRQMDGSPEPGRQGGADEILRWPGLPISYCLDLTQGGYADDAAFERLVEKAFVAWGIPAQLRGPCESETREADGRNEIGWGAPPVPPANGPGVYEAGYTRIRYRDCTRNCRGADSEVIEADIIIDRNAPRNFRNERCLYSVLLHEIGHLLGLPHLPAPAVMAAVTTSCPQSLTNADKRALEDRYGPDAPQH
jgi:matrixin